MPAFRSRSRPLRIFIVENHADTLKYLTLYLQQEGYSVSTARTMTEALGALAVSQPDVLISDIGLPDGNGWELIEKANLPESTFTIAMSGYPETRAEHEKTGYRKYLVKPFNPGELDRILEPLAQRAE
jgi:DNA-binding response OmpR family regulator